MSTKFTFGYNRTKTAPFTSTSTNIWDDLAVDEKYMRSKYNTAPQSGNLQAM